MLKELIAGSVFLSLLIFALAIFLNYCIAKEFERIAEMKGHAGRRYFWWTFFTGLIGMLMVAALPTMSPAAREEDDPDDLPEI